MEKKRPVSVLIIAIINIVFGVFGIIGVFYAVVMQFADPTQKALQERMGEEIPGYLIYQYGVGFAFSLLLSVLLIVSAVGLIKMHNWGRMLSITYSILSILSSIGVLVYALVFILPAINPIVEDVVPEMPQVKQLPREQHKMMVSMMQMTMSGAIVVAPICGCIYPIISLIVMLLPSVGRAFRAPAAKEGSYREEDDDSFGREKEYDY